MYPILEREKSLERQIRAFHWVRLLAELPDRRAGGPGEREAAERVEAWMRDVGAESVTRAAVPARPRPGLVLALHLGVAALGCGLGGLVGFGLAALAAFSFRRERGRGERWLSALLPEIDSVNSVGRAGPVRPRRRIVLSAHLDAGPASRISWQPLADLVAGRSDARLERLLLASAVVAGASALGASGWLMGSAQLALCFALAALGLGGLERGLASASPGASCNASGVAAMLTCGEQLLARLPDDVELWLLGSGAGVGGASGMRAFLDAHPDWSGDRTWFVSFSNTGGHSLHYVREEGEGVEATTHPPMLTELARRVAASGAYAEVTPSDVSFATEGRLPAERHCPTLSLVSLEADGRPREDRQIGDVPESLEMETVVRAADFGAAVLSAALRGEAQPLALV